MATGATWKYLVDSLSPGHPTTDAMIQYITSIFGADVIPGLVSGGTATVIGVLVKYLLSITTLIAMWRVGVNLYSAMVNTAHDGEVAGKDYHSFWAPIRQTVAIFLISPIAGGFCLAQVLVVAAAVNGVALANMASDRAVKSLIGQGVPLFSPTVAASSEVPEKVLEIMTCRAAMNYDSHAQSYLHANFSVPDGIDKPIPPTEVIRYVAPAANTAKQEIGIAIGNRAWSGSLSTTARLPKSAADHLCGAAIGSIGQFDLSSMSSLLGNVTTEAIKDAGSKLSVNLANAQIMAIQDLMRYQGGDGYTTSDAIPSPAEIDNSLLGKLAMNIVLQTRPGHVNRTLGYGDLQDQLAAVDYSGYLTAATEYYAKALHERSSKAFSDSLNNQAGTDDLVKAITDEGWTSLGKWSIAFNQVNAILQATAKNSTPQIVLPNYEALNWSGDDASKIKETVNTFKSSLGVTVASVNQSTGAVTADRCEKNDDDCRTKLINPDRIAEMVNDQWAGTALVKWATGTEVNDKRYAYDEVVGFRAQRALVD
jgi:conjugal transfer/type IV secretion protein DotA/TraY